jgi:hypothetical protein
MGSFIFLELDQASPRRAETGRIKQGSQGAANGYARRAIRHVRRRRAEKDFGFRDRLSKRYKPSRKILNREAP